MSNVAVPSGCKIHGASDVFSRCERDLRCSVVDVGFDLRFDVGFQFLSQAVDDFDSVVIERVVLAEIIIPQSSFRYGQHRKRSGWSLRAADKRLLPMRSVLLPANIRTCSWSVWCLFQ